MENESFQENAKALPPHLGTGHISLAVLELTGFKSMVSLHMLYCLGTKCGAACQLAAAFHLRKSNRTSLNIYLLRKARCSDGYCCRLTRIGLLPVM